MRKNDVWAEEAPSYPFALIEIQGRTKLWQFRLRKMDAFDEARRQKTFKALCDQYLGVPKKIDKRNEVVERETPTHRFPSVGGKILRPDEGFFWVAAGLATMQDWSKPDECYDPEEFIALAVVDQGVWDELRERAGQIDESELGNECPEGVEAKSEPPSSSSTTILT